MLCLNSGFFLFVLFKFFGGEGILLSFRFFF
jgi:hypothetical protein